MNWITNLLRLTLTQIILPRLSVVWFMSWKCHEKSTPLTLKPKTNYANVVLSDIASISTPGRTLYYRVSSLHCDSTLSYSILAYFKSLVFGSPNVATENAQLPVSLITQLSHTEIFGAQLNNQPLSATSITDSTLIGSPSPLLPPLPTLQQSARFNCCWIIELSLSLSSATPVWQGGFPRNLVMIQIIKFQHDCAACQETSSSLYASLEDPNLNKCCGLNVQSRSEFSVIKRQLEPLKLFF